MHQILHLCLLLSTILLPLAAHSEEASFPCKAARTEVEKRICYSPYATLKRVDRDLAKYYKRAIRASGDPERLRADQKAWLESRDTCLTSEFVEPVKYVCDAVHDPEGKTQCHRDFCLVLKYHYRSRFLYWLPAQGATGQYKLSGHWPSGIRDYRDFMTEENIPFCKEVEAILFDIGPLSGPLTETKPFSESSSHIRVSWEPVEMKERLAVAIQLEKSLRQGRNRTQDFVESVEFSKQLASRIATGEITIEIATPAVVAGLGEESQKASAVLRYKRWAGDTKLTEYDYYQRVEFFLVNRNDLSSARAIQGTAEDAFVHQGALYFDSVYPKRYEGEWSSLPIEQPELNVYSVLPYGSNRVMFRTVCRLLYTYDFEN